MRKQDKTVSPLLYECASKRLETPEDLAQAFVVSGLVSKGQTSIGYMAHGIEVNTGIGFDFGEFILPEILSLQPSVAASVAKLNELMVTFYAFPKTLPISGDRVFAEHVGLAAMRGAVKSGTMRVALQVGAGLPEAWEEKVTKGTDEERAFALEAGISAVLSGELTYESVILRDYAPRFYSSHLSSDVGAHLRDLVLSPKGVLSFAKKLTRDQRKEMKEISDAAVGKWKDQPVVNPELPPGAAGLKARFELKMSDDSQPARSDGKRPKDLDKAKYYHRQLTHLISAAKYLKSGLGPTLTGPILQGTMEAVAKELEAIISRAFAPSPAPNSRPAAGDDPTLAGALTYLRLTAFGKGLDAGIEAGVGAKFSQDNDDKKGDEKGAGVGYAIGGAIAGDAKSAIYRFQVAAPGSTPDRPLVVTQDSELTYAQVVGTIEHGASPSLPLFTRAGSQQLSRGGKKDDGGKYLYNSMSYRSATLYWEHPDPAGANYATTPSVVAAPGSGLVYGVSVSILRLVTMAHAVTKLGGPPPKSRRSADFRRFRSLAAKLHVTDQEFYDWLTHSDLIKSSVDDLRAELEASKPISAASQPFQAVLLEAAFTLPANTALALKQTSDPVPGTTGKKRPRTFRLKLDSAKTLRKQRKAAPDSFPLQTIRTRFRIVDVVNTKSSKFALGFQIGASVGVELSTIKDVGLDGIIELDTYWREKRLRRAHEKMPNTLSDWAEVVPPTALLNQ